MYYLKNFAPLRKLFFPSGVPSWLWACFCMSQNWSLQRVLWIMQ